MRISVRSSDVCSSDLLQILAGLCRRAAHDQARYEQHDGGCTPPENHFVFEPFLPCEMSGGRCAERKVCQVNAIKQLRRKGLSLRCLGASVFPYNPRRRRGREDGGPIRRTLLV